MFLNIILILSVWAICGLLLDIILNRHRDYGVMGLPKWIFVPMILIVGLIGLFGKFCNWFLRLLGLRPKD